jgi:hypothetical protein
VTLVTAAAALILVMWLPQQGSPTATQVPDFKVQIWGGAAADFNARMSAYEALRGKLEEGLPRLEITADPAEILRAENLLAERIRKARRGARRGSIFSQPIRAAFRRALKSDVDAGVCESIRDDNPGEFDYRINGTYPKYHPVSTVPPTVLAALPELPAGVYYRFLGQNLVLHDTHANVILDEIEHAVTCPRRR